MTSTKKLKTDNIESIVNWFKFNSEHVESMLVICRKNDSFIPGALKEAYKFIKELNKILKIWEKHKDNPARFIQELTDICDQCKTGMTQKNQNGQIEKPLN